MCCGRGKSSRRPRVRQSGRIKRPIIQALSNDDIENRERLQPPSDGKPDNSPGIVDETPLPRPELLP